MRKAIYPGSFDPFTNGHLDIVKKSAALFDEVHVVIGVNSQKRRTFEAEAMRKAIEAVMDSLQITNVKVEVYEGLVAAEKIYTALGLTALAAEAADLKQQVYDAIEKYMWVEDKGYYEVALGVNNDSAYAFTWTNFYPCATAQLFPISCGLLDPNDARSLYLYEQFNAYFSTGERKASWEEMSTPDSFYWGSLAYTAALMGDNARLETYMSLYLKIMKRHAYPLYNADAARVCMAAQVMLEKLQQGGN